MILLCGSSMGQQTREAIVLPEVSTVLAGLEGTSTLTFTLGCLRNFNYPLPYHVQSLNMDSCPLLGGHIMREVLSCLHFHIIDFFLFFKYTSEGCWFFFFIVCVCLHMCVVVVVAAVVPFVYDRRRTVSLLTSGS